VELTLKPISKDGILEAISKAELYRYLNEPGEAESICRDILAADSENQTALRLLGLRSVRRQSRRSLQRSGHRFPKSARRIRALLLRRHTSRAASESATCRRARAAHGRAII
jgi:hypothetical protein